MKQKILYISSTSIILISTLIYTLGAFFTCNEEGYTFINTTTLIANILYIPGYVADITAESIILYNSTRETEYLYIHLELHKTQTPDRLYSLSSFIFTFSAFLYIFISIATGLTSGFDRDTINTLLGNSFNAIGYLIYSIALSQKSEETKHSLVNRAAMPLFQHMDF